MKTNTRRGLRRKPREPCAPRPLEMADGAGRWQRLVEALGERERRRQEEREGNKIFPDVGPMKL